MYHALERKKSLKMRQEVICFSSEFYKHSSVILRLEPFPVHHRFLIIARAQRTVLSILKKKWWQWSTYIRWLIEKTTVNVALIFIHERIWTRRWTELLIWRCGEPVSVNTARCLLMIQQAPNMCSIDILPVFTPVRRMKSSWILGVTCAKSIFNVLCFNHSSSNQLFRLLLCDNQSRLIHILLASARLSHAELRCRGKFIWVSRNESKLLSKCKVLPREECCLAVLKGNKQF